MSFVRRRIVKRLDLLNLVSILLLILNPSFNLIVTSCKCKYKWIISLLSRSFVFDVKRGIQWDTFLCEFRLSDEWRKCFDGRALDSGYVQLTVNHSRNFVVSEIDGNIQDEWGLCWKDAIKWNLKWLKKKINESSAISISLFEKFIIYHRKNNTFLSASLIKWNMEIKKIFYTFYCFHISMYPHFSSDVSTNDCLQRSRHIMKPNL